MKSRKKMNKMMLLVLVALLVAVAGCGSSSNSNSGGGASTGNENTSQNSDANTGNAGENKSGGDITIGMAHHHVSGNSYFSTYAEAFTEYAKELGVKTVELDAGGDAARQMAQVEDLIQQKVDVIIIWPTNGKAIVPAVKKAKEAGIPVIITNSPIDESGNEYIVAFTGPDNVTEGRYAAELLVEALDGKGKVVEITGLPGYVTTIERSQGFHEVIENYPEIEVLDSQPGDWNREKAQQVMENLLTKYPDIDGVYAADDNMGVGALNAIKAAGREGIKIVGATNFAVGYEALERGEIYGSVYQSPVDDAKIALDTAIKVANGEEVPFNNYFDTPKIHLGNYHEFEKPVF